MAAGILLVPGWTPAVDSDGAPIPNARAYYYLDETTTLAPIFSDEGLATPLANPVEANSSGRWPIIWASDANTYTWSIEAPYGPPGLPFTGTGLTASQATDLIILEGVNAAADQADLAAAAALDAYNDILALAAAAPDTDPVVIAGKANVSGSNILGANQAAFTSAIAYVNAGAGAVQRSVMSKLRETVSVEDFIPSGFDYANSDATPYFTAAINSLPAAGGDVLVGTAGPYRINLSINKPNVRLVGRGGVGELSSPPNNYPSLRPFNTGAGTYVIRLGDGIVECRRNKLDRLSICGTTGAGAHAAYALLLVGGVYNCQIDVDVEGGMKSFAIDPRALAVPGTLPVYGVEARLALRNDINDVNKRGVYIRKYADASGYVTAIDIKLKGNFTPSSAGYWCELDGTGSTGLAARMTGYVDHAPNYGILMHGLETIISTGLQLDPGALNTDVITRLDNVKDISRFVHGFIEGIEGQRVRFLDTTSWTFPTGDIGPVGYRARWNRAYMGSITYWTPDDSIPYAESIYTDFVSGTGPMRWNGCAARWTDATQTTSLTTGSGVFDGGLAVAKNLRVGGVWYNYDGAGNVVATQEVNGSVGWRIDLVGSGSNYRITPGSGGFVIPGGSGVSPLGDNAQVNGQPGNAFSNTQTYKVTMGTSATGPTINFGAATPEGAVTATVGSIYLRSGGGALTSFYVKETNSGGNTGWVAK